ncbi:MAG: hypothetical protein IIV68_02675 [Alistipes sp.]|nr:hypothetical protein [Alistipes sp.]
MKRLSIYITLLTLLFSSCNYPPVPLDSLTILGGVSNNQLLFEGKEGATTTLSFSAKLPWEILDTPGVTFTPASGEAADRVSVKATINSANRSLSTREIGPVIIRISRTRFTGITAYQRSLVELESQQFMISSEQNRPSEFIFKSKHSDVEVIPSGDITISKLQTSGAEEYILSVSATKDNLSTAQHTAGYLTFKVEGTTLDGKVEVVQSPALAFDRSRITVGGNVGEKIAVSVAAAFDFNVTTTSSAISATRNAEGKLEIVTLEANATNAERKLGSVTITLADNPACSATIDVWQRKALSDHTMMFYLLGTSLKSYYDTNIATVESQIESGVLGDTRVVVFIQSSTNSGKLFEIFYDEGLKAVVRDEIGLYNLPAQYSEQMLSQILQDMAHRAPAKEYGLYIGSHGKGWIPKSSGSSSGSSTYSTFSAEQLEAIWTPAPGAIMVRHIGDTASTQIDTTELAAAIRSTNIHLDYIVFDACYMANVESAYDLRDVTDYILGSPCEIIASGMPYNEILPIMVSASPLLDRLNSSAKAFVDYYKVNREGAYSSACSAVIDCRTLDALAEITKRVNGSLNRIDPNTVQAYDGISLSKNPTHIFFDFEDYVIKACSDSALAAEFSAQYYRTVTGLHHTKTFYSAYNNKANPIDYYSGLTTSAPIMWHAMSAYVSEWKECAWYKATH